MSDESEFFEESGSLSHEAMYCALPEWERMGIQFYKGVPREDLYELVEIRFKLHCLTPPSVLPEVEEMVRERKKLKERRHYVNFKLRGHSFTEYDEGRKVELEVLGRLNDKRNELVWRNMDQLQRGGSDENN